MTETVVAVEPSQNSEEQAATAAIEAPQNREVDELEVARELVRQARDAGVALTGPDGLLNAAGSFPALGTGPANAWGTELLIVDPVFDGLVLVTVLGKLAANAGVDRIDGVGSGRCCYRGVPNLATSIRQDSGQRDQIGVRSDVGVDVGVRGRQCEPACPARPPAVDPSGVPNREVQHVVVTVMQSRMALSGGDHGRRAAQIALIVEGVGARTDPATVPVADGGVVGEPAVDGLVDTAACHAQPARGSGVAALSGGVAVAADQPY
jgi:hypothetical protein